MTGLIVVKSKSNRIDVTTGQRAASYITLDDVFGYTPLISLVWSSHSTTITGDCHIVSDRVYFYFDAKDVQTSETFTAVTVYVKTAAM